MWYDAAKSQGPVTLHLHLMKTCPLHPMHHRGRAMCGKWVGMYTIPRPVEKRMIVPNADLRWMVKQAMADVYWQVANAVLGKLVHISHSVSCTPEKDIQEDIHLRQREAQCMSNTKCRRTDSEIDANVMSYCADLSSEHIDIAGIGVRVSTQLLEMSKASVLVLGVDRSYSAAPAECNLSSEMCQVNKGVWMYKSSKLGQISSGRTMPVCCASLEPIEFEQHHSSEAGIFRILRHLQIRATRFRGMDKLEFHLMRDDIGKNVLRRQTYYVDIRWWKRTWSVTIRQTANSVILDIASIIVIMKATSYHHSFLNNHNCLFFFVILDDIEDRLPISTRLLPMDHDDQDFMIQVIVDPCQTKVWHDSSISELDWIVVASYDKSKLSSPSNSPPNSPPSIGISESESIVSEEDDNFPVTPDSKWSGGHTSSTPESKRHTKLYHSYLRQQLLSGDRYHDRAEQILHRQSCQQYSEVLSTTIKDMSPHTFHCAIHYKEAVQETLRMKYLYRGWLLETSRRLSIFNESLHHETEMELGKVDQELQWLVYVLVDRGGSLRTTDNDIQYTTSESVSRPA
ncbi:uncharacterized protein EDB93DRAFT_1102632 [Suillus bovinus]|uniref:uncharacterized protein n=1 Tax=Suillus bovinus TaxID=48563 RepID=UPI001B8745AA|nr:uncharacterized protein EDB93DRAFT_1102632 [Suillus bovinus]KAG2153481.1 hypothetical protein EDB93DRAFT_1102632 [Suillus bovinus]